MLTKDETRDYDNRREGQSPMTMPAGVQESRDPDAELLGDHPDLSPVEREHLSRLDWLWSRTESRQKLSGAAPPELPMGWRWQDHTVLQLPLFGVGFVFDGEKRVCVIRVRVLGITVRHTEMPFRDVSIELNVQPYRKPGKSIGFGPREYVPQEYEPLCYLVLKGGAKERWLHHALRYLDLPKLEVLAAAIRNIGVRFAPPVVHKARPPDPGRRGAINPISVVKFGR